MTNFTEKIWSVINKNLLVNLPPKLTLYHFHRLSKELKTKVNFFYSFGQISLLNQSPLENTWVFWLQCATKSRNLLRIEDLPTAVCCRNFVKFLTFMRNFNSRFETLWKWHHFNFGAKLTRIFLLWTDRIFSVKFVI